MVYRARLSGSMFGLKEVTSSLLCRASLVIPASPSLAFSPNRRRRRGGTGGDCKRHRDTSPLREAIGNLHSPIPSLLPADSPL